MLKSVIICTHARTMPWWYNHFPKTYPTGWASFVKHSSIEIWNVWAYNFAVNGDGAVFLLLLGSVFKNNLRWLTINWSFAWVSCFFFSLWSGFVAWNEKKWGKRCSRLHILQSHWGSLQTRCTKLCHIAWFYSRLVCRAKLNGTRIWGAWCVRWQNDDKNIFSIEKPTTFESSL